MADLSLALWAAHKVHLPLVIIQDSLHVARELEVLTLPLTGEGLVIFKKIICHLLYKAMLVSSPATVARRAREGLKAGVSVGSIPLLKLERPVMVRLDIDTGMVVARVEAFATEV